MFNLRKITFLVSLAGVCVGCGDTHSSQVADCFDLKRLQGRWEYMDNRTYQIEEWIMTSDKQLQGKGFVLDGNDTTFIEFLSIAEEAGKLVYYARPSEIASPEVVPFPLEAEGKDKLVFSNENNDFPKKIVYQLQSDSAMQVYIEGPRDGKYSRIVFDFVKQKNV
ncbi:MAG TPA: DUF6265 family protein [Flavobacteriales bacterium]